MITQIFPRAYKRYLSLIIFGSIIDDFFVWSHKRGYTTNTIKHNLSDIRLIDNYFLRQGTQCLDDLSHNNFERAWLYYCRPCRKARERYSASPPTQTGILRH